MPSELKYFRDKKLNFDLLKPLIHETAVKIETMQPLDAQNRTGQTK